MAQPVNLVPNGSFEDTVKYGNGLFFVKTWDMTLRTPDYFHSAYSGLIDSRKIPQSYYGYQYPKNGEAYIGIGIKDISDPEVREYIQIKLKKTLRKDSLYNVSFWINMPDSFHWACEQKNIAFAFSDTMIEIPWYMVNTFKWLSPGYSSDSIWDPTNKIGWEKFARTYKATGKEKYLIIGNFLDSNDTKLTNIGGGEKEVYKAQSYYFIDHIELYKYSEIDTASSPVDTKRMLIPNVFTPNGDAINDKWTIGNDSTIQNVTIFNRWGEKIKEWNFPGNSWDGDDYPSGLYYYKVVYMDKGVQKVETGSITLMR